MQWSHGNENFWSWINLYDETDIEAWLLDVILDGFAKAEHMYNVCVGAVGRKKHVDMVSAYLKVASSSMSERLKVLCGAFGLTPLHTIHAAPRKVRSIPFSEEIYVIK